MPDEQRDRYIEGYRWCSGSQAILPWREGQEFGCAWCGDVDNEHRTLVLASYAAAAWESEMRMRRYLSTLRVAEMGEPEETVAQVVAHYRAAAASRTFPGQITNLVKGMAVAAVRAIANARWAHLEHDQVIKLHVALENLVAAVDEFVAVQVNGLAVAKHAALAVLEAVPPDEVGPFPAYPLDLDLPAPDPEVPAATERTPGLARFGGPR